LAGLTPASVICEVIKDDGTMARLPDLLKFADVHGLKIGTIADLIHYRLQNESIIERVSRRNMHTAYGTFEATLYRDAPTGAPHLALVKGQPQVDIDTAVRVHEPLSVLDMLETASSTHSWNLDAALRDIAAREVGVVVMLNCDSPRERFFETFAAFDEADKAQRLAHRPVDFKTYGVGAQILRDLGVGKMQVLSAPRKLGSMSGYGLEVTGFISMPGQAPTMPDVCA
jgi:3,4-dihydroxy 2-butanone 4-phosphate synthase/GTP cyclohydrolase II